MLLFKCPNCQTTLSCDEIYAGQSVQCLSCGTVVIAPEPVPPSAPVSMPVPVLESTSAVRKSNMLKIALIVIAVAVVFILGVIGGRIWATDKGSAQADETASGDGGEKSTSLTASSTFTVKLPGNVTLELVRIPKGEFMMGSPATEAGRKNDEVQHRVTLTQDFFLGKYEVTQAQWQAVMGNDPSYFKGSYLPVEQVSWHDAMQFCETLTAIGHREGWLPENWMFTLPTEAQWEYACRAGTDTPFSYGNQSDVSKMNFDGNYPYGGANRGVYRQSTVDVGSLGYRNNFGLYDMHGNVEEWCLDYYGAYSTGSVSDPFCATGSYRVLRGGNWFSYARVCRSANRSCSDPARRDCHVGFRLALVEITSSAQADETASGDGGEKPTSLTASSTFTARLPGNVTLELLRIPKGEFMMGSPATEAGRVDNEIQHRVTLTKDFFLGKYEVTQAQWQAVMGNNPSYFRGPCLPVEQVSWHDAMQFCETLTATGHREGWLPENWKFTLPTEAQWEYACRAGTDTPFSYGSSSDVSKMNFNGNYPYGGANRGVYRQSTVDVGSLGYRNNFGLYDMHGNVFEWCLDYYGSYSRGAVSDPVCVSGSDRVVRGGSWYNFARFCCSAFRGLCIPTGRIDKVGFRLALVEVQ